MPVEGGTGTEGVLRMDADCTIRAIRQVHARLRDHRSGDATLRIDCGDVQQVDVTFVQLIASAEATFASRDVGLVLDPLADCVRHAFARSGVALPGARPATGS